MRWTSEERPAASRDCVTLPERSATQVLRRPAAAVDQRTEQGPRQLAFWPRTTRQGVAAATGSGLGSGQERGGAPPWLLIAVGEDRNDPRR